MKIHPLSAAFCCLSLLCLSAIAAAQPTITHGVASAAFDPQQKVFRLDGGEATYAFGINPQGELQSVYWGPRLQPTDPLNTVLAPNTSSFEIDDTPQEFAGWGEGLYAEPSLKITFPDGNRDLVLHYVSHRITGAAIDITLRDIQRDVFVTLHYAIDPGTGIVARSADILNKTKSPFLIEQAAAAEWNLPRSTAYKLRYLTGRWGGETQVQDQSLNPGKTVLESRRGLTAHQVAPWFAIGKDDSVTEWDGQVWFGSLAWSGAWRITIERDQLQQVRVTGGFNPFDFGYTLAPGESLSTPVFYAGVAQHGFSEVTRLQTTFQNTRILPQAPHPRLRPILYNSWEATGFNVTEEGQETLARKAASLGVERFVMDDGWFGKRNDDHAGLGDWTPNPTKFPHGLKPLIDTVHTLGMDFGLWVEPEMVNPDSDLFRKHPDWVIHFEGRPETQARNQLILNMALPAVREYVLGFLDKILYENDIAFLKWDANRNFSEPGWPQVKPDQQKKLYVEYVRGYYGVLRELRARHPKVEIESCSGGGGRVDLGVMALTDEVWVSDNTDPFDRLLIQDGFSYAYTPQIMMAWVTDSPNGFNHRATSLTYRFLSSMQGSLGLGADLNKWTPEDFTTATHMISAYKQIRPLVQQGTLYRLVSPREGSNLSSTESVAPDGKSAVIFGFLHSQQMRYPSSRIFPRGLVATATYKASMVTGKLEPGSPTQASGDYWMHHGLAFTLEGDYDAAAVLLSAQ